MKKELFGTDGIRGEVGKYPLTQEAVFTIGRTLGIWLKQQYPQQKDSLKIVVGKDTRESGDELELALLKGAQLEGVKLLRTGICPTPTIAYLARTLKAQLGIAISASHNPGSDNGIKFFDINGYKLLSKTEEEIEELFFRFSSEDTKVDLSLPDLQQQEEAHYIKLYMDFIKGSLNGFDLSGLKIVVDCAFGSFSKIAPQVFDELRAQVFAMHTTPNGVNINVNCGTLHPQMMANEILRHKADLGIAFDGDGDRVILADSEGNILDGDHILAILGKHLLQQDRLDNNIVIGTEMANVGLELHLKRQGIQMIRAKVGDKYVLQEMLKRQAKLGGEQSGHIIILERTTTGDGLIAALELIKVMLETKKSLKELKEKWERFPQVLVNVKVKEKRSFAQIPGFEETLSRCKKRLGEASRIVVRYSGTEKLARVMVEGRKASPIDEVASSLAKVIADAVGENCEK